MRLIILLLALTGCNSKIVSEESISIKVRKGRVSKGIHFSGNTRAHSQRNFRSEFKGKVTKVYAKTGDRVFKGQTLIRFDDSRKAKLIAQYSKSLSYAKKELAAINSQIEKNRKKVAYYKGLPPFPGQNSVIRKKNATLAILEEDKRPVEKKVAKIQEQLSDQSKLDQMFAIVAQTDGVITKVKDGLSAGAYVEKGEILMQLSEGQKMEVEVKVDERQVVNLKTNSIVKVKIPALRETVEGTIHKVSEVSQEDGIDGPNLYKVLFAFDAPEKMKLGMKVKLEVTPREKENVNYLPHEALLKDDQGRYWVYKKEGDEWVESLVDLGLVGYERAEIRKGVKEGDEILLTGKNAISI